MNGELFRYWPLLLVVLALVILRYLRPIIKGYLGELTVRFILLFLNKQEYKVINNMRLFYNGIMAQIDHLVISRYGIFVIETKNYTGWIFGSEHAYEWKQVIFKRTFPFYNPLKQNLGHIKALQANLAQYPDIDYYPIVVFTGGAKLKVNSSIPVIKYYHLLRTIKNTKDVNMTEDMRDEVYETLLKLNGQKALLTPKKAAFDNQEPDAAICPHCDSPLITRRGKYGQFWGCSDYPRCKYTKRM